MASFPTTVSPSYNFSKKSAPNVNIATFGDGYSQRATFGINQNLKVLHLKWEYITETQADEIETFLDARAGVENFDFTAPGESSSSKYICSDWMKDIPYPTLATINATFTEVAEP